LLILRVLLLALLLVDFLPPDLAIISPVALNKGFLLSPNFFIATSFTLSATSPSRCLIAPSVTWSNPIFAFLASFIFSFASCILGFCDCPLFSLKTVDAPLIAH
tara:strand:+ start:612 stop:923 length:312 start_codon:yes stop_codon:yes gene_type:complete